MNRAHRLLLAIGCLAVAACSEPPPPPRKAPPPPPPPAVDTEAAKPPTSIYVYSPIGKRDPFQDATAMRRESSPAASGRKPTPLQRWALDSLRLTFTVTGTASPLAMVEDPDGRGWPIRIGDFIGKNWGKVTSIQRDQVIVTETITDNTTGRVYPVELKLQVPVSKEDQADLQSLREGEKLEAYTGKGQ